MSKWEWKKLGEVYDFTRGLTYSKKDEVESSSNCILRSNNIDLQTNSINLDELKYIKDEIAIPQEKYVRKNTILICMSNGSKAHLGKVAYIDKDYDFAFGGFMGLLKPKCEINGKFVHLYLCSDEYKNFIKSLSDGANINNLKFDDLRKFEIPFPPLSEQNRIVKFLDEEFSKIDTLKTNAETNLKNAKELFETTLEKELNPLSRHSERSEESRAELPSGWEWKTLGDVCYRIKRGKAPKYVEQSDVLVFAQKCNQPDGTMSLEKALCLDPSILGKYKAEDYVKEGDVLVNSTGNGTVGRVGFFNNKLLNNKKTVVPDTHITTIRGLANTFPKYLYYFLKPKESYLSDKSLGTTNMKELHADVLEHLQIPLPPLSVQKEIVARLDKLSESVKRLEANYKQIIANCDELKKSILKKTFEGES